MKLLEPKLLGSRIMELSPPLGCDAPPASNGLEVVITQRDDSLLTDDLAGCAPLLLKGSGATPRNLAGCRTSFLLSTPFSTRMGFFTSFLEFLASLELTPSFSAVLFSLPSAVFSYNIAEMGSFLSKLSGSSLSWGSSFHSSSSPQWISDSSS